MAIPVILLLFVIGVLGYGFCIYNGYLLLNNPSKKQYPVSVPLSGRSRLAGTGTAKYNVCIHKSYRGEQPYRCQVCI